MAGVLDMFTNPKWQYYLMYAYLLFMVVVIYLVGYSAMLTFTGSCEVMKEEDVERKNEKAIFYTINNGRINVDEICGIGLMGVSAAFIWGALYDFISRLAEKPGKLGSFFALCRQFGFALTAAIPVIAYACSVPMLKDVEDRIDAVRGTRSKSVCDTPNSSMKALKMEELYVKSLQYGSLSFGIGLLLALFMINFLKLYIRVEGCVPWGIYCVTTIILCISCIAFAGRFYYTNLECCNRISTTGDSPEAKLQKALLDKSKGFDRLLKLKPPCTLLKAMSKVECPEKKRAMQDSCTTNTILTILFIVLGIVLVFAVIMFGLAVSYLSEIAWECL